MFTVKVSQELLDYCLNLVDNTDFGQRHTANGTKEQQLTGIIGQCVIMDLFNLKRITGESGCDDGVDIVFNNKKIDVKTMGRTTDVRRSFTNNFLKLQDYFTTEVYIFCSYHKQKREITVCGWIGKEEFKNKRRYYPTGAIRRRSDGTTFKTFSDLYEIDNIFLNDVNNIQELKDQLNRL